MQLTKKYWVDKLGLDWANALKDVLRDPYMEKLMKFLNTEYSKSEIYPDRQDVFRAFKMCPFDKMKVVIVGLDPAWTPSPNGLAYGTNSTETFLGITYSEIRKRIENDFHNGLCIDFDFTFEKWANQGVLLLNTALTAPKYRTAAHQKPWNKFTRTVIQAINDYRPGTVFMFWGEETQYLISDLKNQDVLVSEHPASAGKQYQDWDTEIFKNCNKLLTEKYGEDSTIEWA